VAQVQDSGAVKGDAPDAKVVQAMFRRGLEKLTGKNMKQSFGLLFGKDDIIGIKVNPAGGALQSSRPELVDAVIAWLKENGVPAKNIIIWDRFDYMLKDAGFTAERFPGIALEGLQTMDEAAADGKTEDNSRWLDAQGKHISYPQFDQDVFYWADVDGPTEHALHESARGQWEALLLRKLVTQRLTKIINIRCSRTRATVSRWPQRTWATRPSATRDACTSRSSSMCARKCSPSRACATRWC